MSAPFVTGGGVIDTALPCRVLAVLLAFTLPAPALTFRVEHTVHDRPLQADSLRYQTATGDALSFTRVSYLLSDFAVRDASGAWIPVPDTVAWMDVETRRDTVTLAVTGNVTAVRFTVGVTSNINHGNPAAWPAGHALNPSVNHLHWDWQGGYIFLALEGLWRAPGATNTSGYVLHLARDGRDVPVTLELPGSVSAEGSVTAAFDLGRLLTSPQRIDFTRDGFSTHSRDGDDLASRLVHNLPGAWSVVSLDATHPPFPAATPPRALVAFNATPWRFRVPGHFPLPELPRDNPLTEQGVALGERLFHDTRLSRDGTLSCASCHQEEHAFSDPRRVSPGVAGAVGRRQSMALQNLAWKQTFFWDGRAASLREQVLQPVQDHKEMAADLGEVTKTLAADTDMRAGFVAAFGDETIVPDRVARALEQFVLTLTAQTSKLDAVRRGNDTLTDEEKRGMELFFTEYEPRTGQRGGDCFHCHGGALFTQHTFHNNGLGDTNDLGRYEVTHRDGDRGKFVAPSLRNVARTAPYMHDGRFQTLEQVIDHYDHGVVRSDTLDPNLAKHPVAGLGLSAEDKHALVAFLKTLNDESLSLHTASTPTGNSP